MSVIMKALAAKRSTEKQNSASTASTTASAPTGIHMSGVAFSAPRPKRFTRLAKGLVILLVLVSVVSGGAYVYRQQGWSVESIQTQVRQWMGVESVPLVQPKAFVAEEVMLPAVEKTVADQAQEARNLFANRHYDESLKRFQSLVEQHSGDVQLHNDLAMVFIKKELYSSAEKHLARALELNPDCAVCYGNLGYLKSLLQAHVEAETYLKKAIRLKPEEAAFHFNLAVLYEKNGDVGSGAQHYQLFLDLSPDQTTELVQKVKDRIYTLTGQ